MQFEVTETLCLSNVVHRSSDFIGYMIMSATALYIPWTEFLSVCSFVFIDHCWFVSEDLWSFQGNVGYFVAGNWLAPYLLMNSDGYLFEFSPSASCSSSASNAWLLNNSHAFLTNALAIILHETVTVEIQVLSYPSGFDSMFSARF